MFLSSVQTVDYISKVLNSPAFRSFVEKYNLITSVILAMLSILAIVAFAINVARLSAAGDSPTKRSVAMRGLLISFICFAIMGGIDIVYAAVLSLFFSGSGA